MNYARVCRTVTSARLNPLMKSDLVELAATMKHMKRAYIEMFLMCLVILVLISEPALYVRYSCADVSRRVPRRPQALSSLLVPLQNLSFST